MQIQSEKSGSYSWFLNTIQAFEKDDSVNGILIITCDNNKWDSEQLDKDLKSIQKPLLGGIFPGMIIGHEAEFKGTTVVGIDCEMEILQVFNISSEKLKIGNLFKRRSEFSYQTNTIISVVDGMSTGISNLIDAVFYEFGLESNCIGGGAGSLSTPRKKCVLSNKGVFRDSAVLCLCKKKSGVGVKHGWGKIHGPLRVTESQKNIVKSFDWKPAFDVYRDVLYQHSSKIITEDNFSDFAKFYPFGLTRLDHEVIVRDPLMIEGKKSLMFVGDMPEGSFHFVLNGDKTAVISAAKSAAKQAIDAYGDQPFSAILVADCITRALFLGDDIKTELKLIEKEGIPMFGALTFGEICNRQWEYLEFHNKSIVVGVFE